MYMMRRCCGLFLSSLLACAASRSASQVPASDVETLQKQIDRLAENQAKLAANLALLTCSQDLSVVLEGLQAQCHGFLSLPMTGPMTGKAGHGAAGSPPQGATPRPASAVSSDPLAPCPAHVVSATVADLEDSLGVKVSELLYAVPHQVVYFAGPEPSLGADREAWLRDLIDVPFMRSTKLLLVTPPDKRSDSADKRIEWGLKWLSSQHVPIGNITRPLKYNIAVPQKNLRPHDRRGPMEPGDLAQALWIFRLAC